jgi:hypothetical protein
MNTRITHPQAAPTRITTTLFWVGEKATPQNSVSNDQSAWDPDWMLRYGGSDSPESGTRHNYIPVTFVPGLNPFYVALPYNDVEQHHTRPEAARVIPYTARIIRLSGCGTKRPAWRPHTAGTVTRRSRRKRFTQRPQRTTARRPTPNSELQTPSAQLYSALGTRHPSSFVAFVAFHGSVRTGQYVCS